MTRLSPGRAFTLYGLVVIFVFVAFVLGLLIGTGSARREAGRQTESPYEPVQDLESQLEFYDELSKPIEDVERESPTIILERGPRPETAEITREEPPEPSSERPFTIQVAAHSTSEEAEQVLLRLSTRSFQGRVRAPEPDEKDKYFRVWVGEFSTVQEAETFAVQLKEEGFHTYIRKIR